MMKSDKMMAGTTHTAMMKKSTAAIAVSM
jgi:hypothetical protein